ncbi:MAG: nucleoside deaminase [Planctomycetota bacterium]|nr:MAG: nucleoside deaminase [Planctomycetota bacterium]
MELALEEARQAEKKEEVPVGAVVVLEKKVIAKAHNLKENLKKATAHAEILALEQASDALGDWRLNGTTLYVTLEPCPMCAGALVHSRVERLVFGAHDPRWGAAGTLMNLVEDKRLNHRLKVQGGVLAQEAGQLLQNFFQQRRGAGAAERGGFENR